MAGVTVSGGSGDTITLPFTSGQNAVVAQALADAVTQAVAAGTLTPQTYTGLSLPPAVAGTEDEIVIKASGPLSLSPQALAVVDTAASSIVFGSGALNETVLGGSGALTFFTRGGSGTITTGDGNNRIIETGASPWSINTGAGNDQVSIAGGLNTISAGTGHNTVLLEGGNNLVSSTGNDTISASVGNDTIVASGKSPIHVIATDADLTFIGGNGAATVLGGAGTDTIFATAGGYFQGGSGGNNLIVGGSGPTTILGGGDGDVLEATGSAGTRLYAAGGNETLDGSLSSGRDLLQAGAGSDQLTGGFGDDTLIGGTGSVTMQGGFGKDVFQFINGDASNALIVDFSDTKGDSLNLKGFAADEVSYALQHVQYSPSGAVVTLSDNTRITLTNVSDLSKSSFS